MTEPVPAWARAPVALVDADPTWPSLAATLAAELAEALAGELRSAIVHVGSTAVPGLRAKPVIDLMALVDTPASTVTRREERLIAARWFLVPPELDARPWRRLLVRPTADDRHRVAHLHLMPPGEPRWDEQRRFRDVLRARPELAAQYADLKTELAACARDREEYTEAKASFVRRVLDEAGGLDPA